jgi:hypothetical protein
MFKLGCRIEGDERNHHHPRFDVDEGCLPIGAAILAEAVLRRLRGKGTVEEPAEPGDNPASVGSLQTGS